MSLSYFFWVLFSELWVAFFPHRRLLCIKATIPGSEELLQDIEFDSNINFDNPMNKAVAKDLQQLKSQLASAEYMLTELQLEKERLKKQSRGLPAASAGAGAAMDETYDSVNIDFGLDGKSAEFEMVSPMQRK